MPLNREEPMHHRCILRALPAAATLFTVLAGCSSVQYRNASHPNYGDAEYKSDLAQCRRQNSEIVTTPGYDGKSELKADEAKVQACIKERGWQAVSQ
jgi:uncharacterized protein YceK